MPEQFELADLGVPGGSAYHRLMKRCPESRLLAFGDGEYLTGAGDASKEIYIVLRGAYAVEQPSQDPGVRPGPLALVVTEDPGTPSFVGEMAYLGHGFRTASVRSSGRTHTLCLKPQHLEVLIEEFPLFTRILCRQFAKRLRETNNALQELQRRLSLDARQFTLAPGEVLVREGEPADTLYQVIDGTLARGVPAGHEPAPFETSSQGYVEPLCYLLDQAYPCTLVAKSRCLVMGVSKASRLALLRNAPELAIECLSRSAENRREPR